MPMTNESSAQKGRKRGARRCAVLILALLAVSVVMCLQMGCAVGQAQLEPEVETKTTHHSGCFAVQVGAYAKRAEAVTMLIKLTETISYPMMLTEVVAKGNVRWRLRVLVLSRDEALKASERLLAEDHIQTWTVPMSCANSFTESDSATPTANTDTLDPIGRTPERMIHRWYHGL
jgi:SPOR domain